MHSVWLTPCLPTGGNTLKVNKGEKFGFKQEEGEEMAQYRQS